LLARIPFACGIARIGNQLEKSAPAACHQHQSDNDADPCVRIRRGSEYLWHYALNTIGTLLTTEAKLSQGK
jgi:hypothetical protein